MPSILLICTANQCRSPLAEVLLRRALTEADLADWSVLSAGTWAEDGRVADSRTQAVAAEWDLDLSRHRARSVDGPMLADTDLVLCMERGQLEALRLEWPAQAATLRLFSELGGLRYDVLDPVRGDLADFRSLRRDLQRLIEEGMPRLTAWIHDRRAKMEGGDGQGKVGGSAKAKG
jgi:protein-tyrosine phosphatase